MESFLDALLTLGIIFGVLILPLWIILWIYDKLRGNSLEGNDAAEEASNRTYAFLLFGSLILIVMMLLRDWLR
jgi:hypothetical protein